MQTKQHDPDDITTPYINRQTGNTCPDCGKQWLDEKPTPGIIHRLRLCDNCKGEIRRTGKE